MRWLLVPSVIGLLAVGPLSVEEPADGRRSIVLEGSQARVVVDILGSPIVDFHLLRDGLNPLRWANDGATDEARSMSHFLCASTAGICLRKPKRQTACQGAAKR